MGIYPPTGGSFNFSQGTIAARPAPSANALYYATDTGEWWVANAAGNAWQDIHQVATLNTALAVGPQASINNMISLSTGLGMKYIGGGVFQMQGGGATKALDASGYQTLEVANGKQGVATLVAGTVTVANTSVTANSRIFLTPQETGVLTGILRVSARVVGTSFTILSSVNTDTAVVAWEIFEPG